MSIPNKELNTAFIYISNVTNNGLSVADMKQLRNIRKDIKQKLTDYDELRKSIWEGYGITTDPQLNEHPEKASIIEKVAELDNDKNEISGLNFLTEEKILECAPKSINQNDIDILMQYLLQTK